jgi:GT2 family glycosyltransferase
LCVAHAGGRAGRAAERAAASDARVRAVRVEEGKGAAAALGAALGASEGEFVAVLAAGDALAPAALLEVALLLGEDRAADVVYTDEEVWPPGAPAPEPVLKPGWSPEYLLSRMYTGRLCVYRRAVVTGAGGFRPGFGGAREYDLALRVAERTGRVRHVPRVLYRGRGASGGAGAPGEADAAALRALGEHVARLGLDAACEPGASAGLYRVRHRVAGEPLVSVVIPTAGYKRAVRGEQLDLLANCVRSIVAQTDYANYEIVCVDNGDLRDETAAALEAHGGRVRRFTFEQEGPFNLAAKMNFGAAQAAGEHLLFLNDDVEVVSAGWMTALLEHSQRPGVGVVGAKLYFPDGSIQHAGVRLDEGCAPGHVYYCYPRESQRRAPDLDAVRNYSAVTGACMMTRAALFRDLGGFDLRFPINYNDVDYCLKALARGLRVVYTPYAELYHFESVSRAAEQTEGVKSEELEAFQKVWGATPEARDAFHNPLADAFSFAHAPGAGGR